MDKRKRTIIIAEVGVNHNGSIKLAKKLIDSAKKAGCDYVKFQSFKTENLVKSNLDIVGYQKKNIKKNIKQYKMLKKVEFNDLQFKELINYCRKKRISFLSSPFDLESLKLLFKFKIKDIKIASGEITHYPLIKKIASSANKIFLSTGMSNMNEIGTAIKILLKNGANKNKIYLLHCHSDYPTILEDVNLLALKLFKEKFKLKIGYSDHTLGTETSIAAIALGASVIEKHITIKRNMVGPDHLASMEINELPNFVKSIKNTEKLLGKKIKIPSKKELKIKKWVRKSIVAKTFIKKNTIFSDKNIICKRPEGGLTPFDWDSVIGKKAKHNFKKDEFIRLK